MRSSFVTALLCLIATTCAAPAPGKDSDCDKTVKPGQSIQKAIDNAKKGDKIVVEAGEYYEQLTITTDGIQLIGKGAKLFPPKNYTKNFCTGLSRSFADGSETDAGICIHGKGFVLAPYDPKLPEHLKISKVGDYIKNVVVTGFNITGFNGENIALIGGKDVKISKNNLVDGTQYGFLTVGSIDTNAENNVITSSTLSIIAMCMDDKSGATFKNNHISNYYIALCGQTPGGELKKNTVKNCCIGPFIDPGIKGMKIIENTITGRNPYCLAKDGAGMVILGASNTIVERNTFESIQNNKTGVGIFISDDPVSGAKASGNVFKKNLFKFNDLDIFNNATTTDNVFRNNECASSVPDGLCNN
ncbi:pectin lyase-like protein [Ophiobolus disseminans]|uniref:Pectin lyase-like protein n=1 Tax=Ophiobolus disseminans TaxID=1469910 RepID=A0A6A7AAW0_9PLEO|nr:pectin lyase-like protein [Ophiobolus disseminans]